MFEQLERAGDIRKTGRFRKGRPVYVTTEKGKTGSSLISFSAVWIPSHEP